MGSYYITPHQDSVHHRRLQLIDNGAHIAELIQRYTEDEAYRNQQESEHVSNAYGGHTENESDDDMSSITVEEILDGSLDDRWDEFENATLFPQVSAGVTGLTALFFSPPHDDVHWTVRLGRDHATMDPWEEDREPAPPLLLSHLLSVGDGHSDHYAVREHAGSVSYPQNDNAMNLDDHDIELVRPDEEVNEASASYRPSLPRDSADVEESDNEASMMRFAEAFINSFRNAIREPAEIDNPQDSNARNLVEDIESLRRVCEANEEFFGWYRPPLREEESDVDESDDDESDYDESDYEESDDEGGDVVNASQNLSDNPQDGGSMNPMESLQELIRLAQEVEEAFRSMQDNVDSL